ncbi:unnamed protein product [Ectocarpus sp. 12 AP-2014]
MIPAAQYPPKGKCCQVFPKRTRSDGINNNNSGPNSSGSSTDRVRRGLRRTDSWRYHPRPRDLSRRMKSVDHARSATATAAAIPASAPGELRRPDAGADCHGADDVAAAAAAAAAAAFVPPSWLSSNNSTDLLMLAAGVSSNNRRGSGSGHDCCTATRSRSMSDPNSTSWSLPSSKAESTEMPQQRQQQPQQQNQQRQEHRHLQHKLPRGYRKATSLPAAVAEHVHGTCSLGDDVEQGSETYSYSGRSSSGCRLLEPELDGVTPEEKRRVRLIPRLPFFSSRQKRIRRTEETPPICDFQDPFAPLPPPSPSSQSTSPRPMDLTPPITARASVRGTIRSSLRRKTNPKRTAVGGRAFFCATSIAFCTMFGPAQALYDTKLSFDPPEVGHPTEVTFTFTPTYSITEGKFIRLTLAGFTRGERNGTAGEDFGFANEEDEGNFGFGWPSDTFRGWWSEGTPEEEYEDSVFSLYTTKTLDADVSYTAIIDRMSGLKSSCGHPANHSAFYAWVDDTTTFYKMFGKVDWTIRETEEIPMSCYVAPTTLTFDPPLPQTMTHITVGFQPARDLVEGDNVTVNLKGFTSGEGNGTEGRDFLYGDLLLAGESSNGSTWLASWEEGTYVEGELGYEDSMLRLQALAPIPAGELHEVTIYRSNGIRAQCGMGENETTSTISVVSASDPPWNSTGEFTFSQAVGPGCRELNYCSGQGQCDYCRQRCDCPEGFGSPSELLHTPDVARDCSEMTCPSGVSWGPVLAGSPRPDPETSHAMAECSNMGTCIRSFGICLCETGYAGRACERQADIHIDIQPSVSRPKYACPEDCSGNGACRNMREMGMMRTAEPLVNSSTDASSSSRGDSADGFEVVYGWDSPEGTATWESRSVFGCVCDSSWEVGLGRGQTQQAQYFGPDCSMLHCPTGDDPDTLIDETDCENKTADGGRGVGSAGNLCHVDCSNRGICDYKTGVCSCFDGYHGQASQQR